MIMQYYKVVNSFDLKEAQFCNEPLNKYDEKKSHGLIISDWKLCSAHQSSLVRIFSDVH